MLNGTIVECNTAYGGGRADTQSHLRAAEEHGFTAIAEVRHHGCRLATWRYPWREGRHLKETTWGSHYPGYDFGDPLHFRDT